MANNSGNAFSSIAEFKGRMRKIVRELQLIYNKKELNELMGPTSLAEFRKAHNKLNSIMWREVGRHPQGVETYPLAIVHGMADISGRRDQHNIEIEQTISELGTLANETNPKQQSDNDQHQESAHLDLSALPSRNHGSSSPSPGDDQASLASHSSGSGNTRSGFFCKTEGCAAANKSFRFLSKLRDHERSHEAPGFECPHCDRKFKQSRILKKHIVRVHKSDQNQGGAGSSPGTILDVTYKDLDQTSKIHAFNMEALQRQTYSLQCPGLAAGFPPGYMPDVLFNPAVFVNSDFIDTDPGVMGYRDVLTYQSSGGSDQFFLSELADLEMVGM